MQTLATLLLSLLVLTIADAARAAADDTDLPRAFKDSVAALTKSGAGYTDLHRAAAALAGNHGATAVPFLSKQVAHENPGANEVQRRLALFTLAKLAGKREAADALATFARDTKHGQVSPDTLLALAFAAPVDARAVLENATQKALTASDFAPLTALTGGLVVAGDSKSLPVLESVVKASSDRPELLAEVRFHDKVLCWRLGLPADKQADAAKQTLFFWRALHDVRNLRNPLGDYEEVAKHLHAEKHSFSVDFLRVILDAPECTSGTPLAPRLLGIVVLGRQRQTDAVAELKKLAAAEGMTGEAARHSLTQIASADALRALESAIAKGAKQRNADIARLLALGGDAKSLELLARLAQDDGFSKEEREAFADAADKIRKKKS